jgi:hypothetical protein
MTPENFLAVEIAENRRLVAAEHGMSTEDWVAGLLAMDEALTVIEEGHGRGDTPEAIAARVPVPAENVAQVLAPTRKPTGKRPTKDRALMIRAQALAVRLKVSMRTAWKYYDEPTTPVS